MPEIRITHTTCTAGVIYDVYVGNEWRGAAAKHSIGSVIIDLLKELGTAYISLTGVRS